MTGRLQIAFESEMASAIEALRAHRHDDCLRHLERAHILGQRFVVPHLRSHWWMFRAGLRMGDAREVLAQIPRLLLAGPGSLLGRNPVGNPGTARVGIFQPVAIPPDLAQWLNAE
jgi:hypothetical protein